MAQISKGDTFTDGQQVTGARLNQLVDSSVLLAGAITDQPNITANTVASSDSVLLYDLSATALREANVSDVLGSNVPVVTSSITAGNTNDILITPNDGVIVSGLAYTSGDGLTVTVTSAAHTLAVGQVILIAGASTGYNGTFRVATILTNSFTYVMTTAATAGSGTLNYTKKGLIKNPANESIAGNLYVDGSTAVAGNLTVAGATTLAGTTTVSGALTSTGTANFTGVLQVNGTVGYVLTEVSEETISSFVVSSTVSRAMNAWHNGFTSSTFTKPSEEIWVFEVVLTVKPAAASGGINIDHYIYASNNANSVIYYNRQGKNIGAVSQTNQGSHTSELKWIVNSGTTLTSETIKLWYYVHGTPIDWVHDFGSTSADATTGKTYPASKLRIYKYKTA